jgi:hypothetical protein
MLSINGRTATLQLVGSLLSQGVEFLKEGCMKRGLFLSVCLAITAVSFGQEKPVSVPVASEIPPGPSMKETEAWIKRELRTM